MPIKFIYFDIGNVFLTYEEAIKQLVKRFGLNSLKIKFFLDKYRDDLNSGAVSDEEVEKVFYQTFPKIDFNLREELVSHFGKLDFMHDFAKEVNRKYQIGLLSNISKQTFDYSWRDNLIPHLNYQTIIKSYEVKLIKPEKEIYLLAQKKANVQANEILFIDDLKENIKTATDLGWQGIVFEYNKPERSIKKIKAILDL